MKEPSKEPRSRRINADLIERPFVDILVKLSADRALLEQAASTAQTEDRDVTVIREQESRFLERAREVGQKISNMLAAIENGITGGSVQLRLSELESELAVVKAELSRTRAKLKETEPEPIDVDQPFSLLSMIAELLPLCTPEEKEALVQAILKKATVDADKAVEFEFYTGIDGDDVVSKIKVGSPTLAIGQHRNERTVRVKAQAGRPEAVKPPSVA